LGVPVIGKPLNDVQRRFNDLCKAGGGKLGGPARTKVQELLHTGSSKLNELAFTESTSHLSDLADRDPWKVCYAVAISWGHLAKLDIEFTAAATEVLDTLNPAAMKFACKFHLERGPIPIEQSLQAGFTMFQRVILPPTLPDTIKKYRTAQERWMQGILDKTRTRPRYMGSWNAVALFMVGLFSNPSLASTLTSAEVALPPNGPVFSALSILHKVHIASQPPSGGPLDDDTFEPGVIYANNGLMAELIPGRTGWNLLDVHSGLYLLGTRDPTSAAWS
jgi:hypothetical protein